MPGHDASPEPAPDAVGGSSFDDESVFTRLLLALEADPALDPAGFLRDAEEESSAACLEKLERLRRHGLLPVREAATAAGSEISAGCVLAGRYRVMERVGSGGMGAVHRAEDTELERIVAVKVAASAAESETELPVLRLARFLREAQITGHLQHPNIVPIHDVGVTKDGRAFLVMKLVEGRNLSEILQRVEEGAEELSIRRGLAIVIRICEALAFAHGRGIVHRDLKPSNVMVGAFGEVQVMDWGLAKRLGEPHGVAPTRETPTFPAQTVSGALIGTPSYMAPEQARGELDAIGSRTDVFGLGAILHHVLAGRPPYWGRSFDEVLASSRAGRRSDPSFRRTPRRPPPELRGVLDRALAADSAERYPTVEAFAADLDAYLGGRRGAAWRDGLFARLVKGVRRRPIAAVAVTSAAVVVAILAVAAAKLQIVRARQRLAEEDLHREQLARRLGVLARALDSAFVAEFSSAPDLAMSSAPSLSSHDDPLPPPPPRVLYEDPAAVVEHYRDVLAGPDVAFHLERGAPIEELAAVISAGGAAEERDRRAALDGLYRLGLHLRGRKDAREAAPAAWPGLWERLCALHEEVDDEPQHETVWSAFLAFVRSGEDHLSSMLEQAGPVQPDATSALFLASFYELHHDDDAAAKYWKRIWHEQPELFLPNQRLCHHYATPGREDWDRAILHGEAALAIAPDAYWVRAVLAVAHANDGTFEESLWHASRLVDEHPDDSRALVRLGFAYRRAAEHRGSRSDLERAAEAYERALSAEASIEAYSNLTFVLDHLEEFARAIEVMQDALHRFPDEPGLNWRLVEVCVDAGWIEQAWALRAELLAEHPEWARFESANREVTLRTMLELQLHTPLEVRPDAWLVFAKNRYVREEFNHAFRVYRDLIHDAEGFFEKTPAAEHIVYEQSGYTPWDSYRNAARAARRVVLGEGYQGAGKVSVVFDPTLPVLRAFGDGEPLPIVAADARTSLAEKPDAETIESAPRLCEEWIVKCAQSLWTDVSRGIPLQSPEQHARFARGVLDDEVLDPMLDLPEPIDDFPTPRALFENVANR